jgi:hypothetical protein
LIPNKMTEYQDPHIAVNDLTLIFSQY